jgi:hypothetical protein
VQKLQMRCEFFFVFRKFPFDVNFAYGTIREIDWDLCRKGIRDDDKSDLHIQNDGEIQDGI